MRRMKKRSNQPDQFLSNERSKKLFCRIFRLSFRQISSTKFIHESSRIAKERNGNQSKSNTNQSCWKGTDVTNQNNSSFDQSQFLCHFVTSSLRHLVSSPIVWLAIEKKTNHFHSSSSHNSLERKKQKPTTIKSTLFSFDFSNFAF